MAFDNNRSVTRPSFTYHQRQNLQEALNDLLEAQADWIALPEDSERLGDNHRAYTNARAYLEGMLDFNSDSHEMTRLRDL